LARDGFVVLTFHKKGFDVPTINTDGERFFASIFKYMKFLTIYGKEFSSIRANSVSKSLEDERIQDIRAMLTKISYAKDRPASLMLPFHQVDLGTIILAGFAESGAAITKLVSEPDFRQKFPDVIGFVGIESPLASSAVLEKNKEYSVNKQAPFWMNLLANTSTFFARLKPKKIIGSEIQSFPQIPALYIVSDSVSDASLRNKRYSSIVTLLQGSQQSAFLTAVPGANSLDYAGLSCEYPLLSFLSGEKRNDQVPEFFPDTASQLIINFSSMLIILKNNESNLPVVNPYFFIKGNIQGDLYLETKNVE
jgi:hypothetical protein